MKNANGLDIEVGKTYITVLGNKVKVISTDFKGAGESNNIVGIVSFESGTDTLCVRSLDETNGWTKYDPLYDLKVDDKVFIRETDHGEWYPQHFAGVENGKIAVFINGKTSFTNGCVGACTFKYWKKAD